MHTSTPTSQHSRLDHAAAVLLRLLTSHRGSDTEAAASELRTRLGDDRLLHLLRARVAHAMLERPTPTDRRALATLDCALDEARREADPGSPLGLGLGLGRISA